MNPTRPSQFSMRQRVVGVVGGCGVALSTLMLAVSLVTAFGPKSGAHAAVASSGSVTLTVPGGVPATGVGSATAFNMTPPQGGACEGPGGSGYRWQAFLAAAQVDASTLTFPGGNATNSGSGFAATMFSSDGNTAGNQFPSTSPNGLIVVQSPFAFKDFTRLQFPAGSYQIGIACTKDNLVRGYWASTITFTTSTTDPLGLTWAPAATPPPTTTTTTVASTTTTTLAATTTLSSTTTTVRPSTTLAGSSTTVAASSTTVAGAGGPTSTVSVNTLPARIPTTGSSSTVMIGLWAVLLLIFGRMALVLSRPVRVLPPKSR